MEIVNKYPQIAFGELNYAPFPGILYQRDQTQVIEYGKEYFNKYLEMDDTEIAEKLNLGRVELSHKYCTDCILDIGVGSGKFIKSCLVKTYGYDINPYGVRWLKDRRCFVNPYENIPADVQGLTLWDSMEHMKEPYSLLKCLRPKTYVFIAMPIFKDLTKVRNSKHYRPNEHLSYWTVSGLSTYMADAGFEWLELSDHETLAGREDILSFVFRKHLSPLQAMISSTQCQI
jgi:hypothetical protein